MLTMTFTTSGQTDRTVKLDSFNENLTTGVLSGQLAVNVQDGAVPTVISGNFKNATSFTSVTATEGTGSSAKAVTISGSYNRIADFYCFYDSANKKYGLSITLDHS